MNGPVKMYQTTQIIRHDLPVNVPNCMYQMKNILSGSKINFVGGEHVSLSSSSSTSVSTSNKTLDISEQVNNFLKVFIHHKYKFNDYNEFACT